MAPPVNLDDSIIDNDRKSDVGEHIDNIENIDTVGHLAHEVEREETVVSAIRSHIYSCLWILYAIWVLIACSFDNQASSSILGIPSFRRDFGYAYQDSFVLPAKWQSAYSGGPAAATVFGAFAAGYISDKIGRKYLIGGAYVLVMVGITLEVIANTTADGNATFFGGKFINGIAIGGLISTVMTYVGELSPTALRGILTAACALAFTIGPFIVSFVVNAFGGLETSWAYKSAFIAQYGVTGIGLAIWPFMPESPTWFLIKGNEAKAIRSLERLGYREQVLEQRLALLKLTLREALKETEGATYTECFKKSNLRRTIIAVMPLSIQAFSGIFWIAGYATYYFQLAGFTTAQSFQLGIAQQCVSVLGNIMSWFMIERYGRRFLSLWGLIILTLLLFVTGGVACVGSTQANKGVAALIIVYCWLYNVTIGATAYVAMTEISTTRLRAKTASLALLIQSAWGTFWSFILPFIFNPDKGNLGGKTAFIFAAQSIVCCVYFYYYHPETKGRSYEELDELFREGVPARKFESFVTTAEQKGQEVKQRVDEGKVHV